MNVRKLKERPRNALQRTLHQAPLSREIDWTVRPQFGSRKPSRCGID
jgi:hypothetical protein